MLITGDITEFGSDDEIRLAKSILDGLNKKWFIVPGNHDSNWSESGTYTFKKTFGSETFYFEEQGIHFIGTVCGPNMRMSPGQVPRENIVWLDSLFSVIPSAAPIIFINHYPLDNSLNNWFEVTERLRKRNVKLVLCGHGHANRKMNVDGMQAVMGRSNLRAKDSLGGYNIVSLVKDSATFSVKKPGQPLKDPWLKLHIGQKPDLSRPVQFPDFSVNDSSDFFKLKWKDQLSSDIGSGISIHKKYLLSSNTNGDLIAYNRRNGKIKWNRNTGAKMYAIPAAAGNMVVAPNANGNINAYDLKRGRDVWQLTATKAVLSHPVIYKDAVFQGSSDNIFRSIESSTGKVNWQTENIKGFVVTKPLLHNGRVYFGSWDRTFYCLDETTGAKIWEWDNGHASRMYSPAAVFPKAVGNRLFIVAPDRYMTCLDAATGAVIWRAQDPKIRVRESMGISADSSMIYVKTMDGDVLGISTTAPDMTVIWKGDYNLGYEISPTEIIEHKGVVFVPTQSGQIVAYSRQTGDLLARYKGGVGLVTSIIPITNKKLGFQRWTEK